MAYPQYYPQINNSQGNYLIWVQGEAAAKSYPIAPGMTIPLWDTETQCIFWKTCDAYGIPSIKIIDYTIRPDRAKTAQNALYGSPSTVPTMSDLSALQGQIDGLKRQIESMKGVTNESALSADGSAKQHYAEVPTVPPNVPGRPAPAGATAP